MGGARRRLRKLTRDTEEKDGGEALRRGSEQNDQTPRRDREKHWGETPWTHTEDAEEKHWGLRRRTEEKDSRYASEISIEKKRKATRRGSEDIAARHPGETGISGTGEKHCVQRRVRGEAPGRCAE